MRSLALGAAFVAATLGVSRAGVAQEQFEKELGIDPAAETTEVVPDAEVAAGLAPATGAGAAAGTTGAAGTATPGLGTAGAGAAGAVTGGESYEAPLSPTSPSVEAARAAVWNSPEMMQAREYITTYGQRSRQFNSANASAYLTRLSQFTPDEMKAWLGRYSARRATDQRNFEVARAARQTAIATNQQRLQAIEQARQSANQWQTEAAITAGMQFGTMQQNAQTAALTKTLRRDQYLNAMQAGNAYDFFVNPPYYIRAAAATVLPGDLPRGDPANFSRGDGPGAGAGGPSAGGGAGAAAGGGAGAGGAAAGGAGGAGAGP